MILNELETAHQLVSPAKCFAALRRISRSVSSPLIRSPELPVLLFQHIVGDYSGVPPADSRSVSGRVEWATDEVMRTYEPLTVGAVLGPETHWPHVFAVTEALAGRFDDDGVRLVVAFD